MRTRTMMKQRSIPVLLLLSCTLCISACAQQKLISNNMNSGLAIAFPGAEGFGKHTTGGRGGKVYIVTNLDDDGPGSLRKAMKSKDSLVVVFAVSGTIHLQSPLNISANKTIAGQTAPGEGICLADYPVKLAGDNIIVRYLRFRMGDRYQNKGKIAGGGHDDALSGYNRNHIIVDHCSISWSTDEVFSIYGGDSVTLQYNIIAEPLNYSYHFEKGDSDFENHGYGGIWGGRRLSAHHNLFAHCISRTPRFQGERNNISELVDFRNNILYNWGHNNVYGGEGGSYNIVNNYYKYGPSTNKKVQYRIVNPSKQKEPLIPFGKYFVHGNYVDGSAEVTATNSLGVHMGDGSEVDKAAALVTISFPATNIPLETAEEAYQKVLKNVGAVLPKRDSLDTRIIDNLKSRSGRIIDVQGGFPHGTPYELTAKAWPSLRSAEAPADTDGDGIPDNWEIKNGLNQNDKKDGAGFSLHPFYSNIEVYINSLINDLH